MEREHDPKIEGLLENFIKSLSVPEKAILARTLVLPNSPESIPEVTKLTMEYGDVYDYFTDRLEKLRQSLGVDYSTLQKLLAEKMVID